MSRLFPLETFSSPAPTAIPGGAPAAREDELEAARLEAFDKGYQSGWDDAAAADRTEQLRIGEEFGRNLRDLGFTYHEARAHVISSAEQVIAQFVEALFTESLGQALMAHIAETVRTHVESAAAEPVRLRVSPQDASALRSLLASHGTVPFEVDEEPSLAGGQVYCILGTRERKVDLVDLLETTRGALAALHDMNERSLKHG